MSFKFPSSTNLKPLSPMNFFITLFAFFLAVQASPSSFAPRADLDVFVPFIISPNSSTIWCIGYSETVEWYVISSRQKVLIIEIPMIQGGPTMLLTLLRMALLSGWITRIIVRVLSVFCRLLLLKSATVQHHPRYCSLKILIFALVIRTSLFPLI